MQRRIRTAMWRGNWVGAGGVMVGAQGELAPSSGMGIIFRLSYNLVVGFVTCLVGGGKGLF